MIRSFPFDAVLTGYDEDGAPIYDRVYSSKEWAGYTSKLFTNGIFPTGENPLMVTAAGSMSLRINPGAININGRQMEIYDAAETVQLAAGDSQPRIDLVSLRLDTTTDVRAIVPVVIRGMPSESPAEPPMLRENNPDDKGSLFDMVIAKIYVPAGAYNITQNNITDTRLNPKYCGTAATAAGGITVIPEGTELPPSERQPGMFYLRVVSRETGGTEIKSYTNIGMKIVD